MCTAAFFVYVIQQSFVVNESVRTERVQCQRRCSPDAVGNGREDNFMCPVQVDDYATDLILKNRSIILLADS